jgi:hypothetical protein
VGLPKLAVLLTLLLAAYSILIALLFASALGRAAPRYSDTLNEISVVSLELLFVLPVMALFGKTAASVIDKEETLSPKSTRTRQKAWTWLHAVFQFLAFVDPFLMFMILTLLSKSVTTPDEYVGLFATFSILYYLSFVYRSSVLGIFGMSYSNLTTPSTLGAASYATLAGSLFDDPLRASNETLRRAMRYLKGSLIALQRTLVDDGVQLESLNKVVAVVDLLSERRDLQNLDVTRLSLLAHNLNRVPHFEDIPDALSRFLHDFPWTENFVEIPAQKMTRFDLLAAAAAVMGGIATVLSLFTPTFGDLVKTALGSSSVLSFVVGLVAAIGSVYLLRPLLRNSVVFPDVLKLREVEGAELGTPGEPSRLQ